MTEYQIPEDKKALFKLRLDGRVVWAMNGALVSKADLAYFKITKDPAQTEEEK